MIDSSIFFRLLQCIEWLSRQETLASKKVTSKAKASNDADSRGKTAATIQQLKKKLAALGAEFEAKFPGVDLK